MYKYLSKMYRVTIKNSRSQRLCLWCIVILLAIFGLFGSIAFKQAGLVNNEVAQTNVEFPQLIRWHFLANSDNQADQRLKLQVRDAVMASAEKWFADAKNLAECREILIDALPKMQALAEARLKSLGSSQTVQIIYGPTYYPSRILLGNESTRVVQAGKYEAVRFVIGEGQGHNWWCLLYPPLSLGSQVIFEVPPQVDWRDKKAGDSVDVSKIKKDTKKTELEVKPCFKLMEIWDELTGH